MEADPGLVIGLSTGLAVFLLVTIGLCCRYARKGKKKEHSFDTEELLILDDVKYPQNGTRERWIQTAQKMPSQKTVSFRDLLKANAVEPNQYGHMESRNQPSEGRRMFERDSMRILSTHHEPPKRRISDHTGVDNELGDTSFDDLVLTYGKQKQRSRLDVRNSRTSNNDVQQDRHSAVKLAEPLKTYNDIDRDRPSHHSVFQRNQLPEEHHMCERENMRNLSKPHEPPKRRISDHVGVDTELGDKSFDDLVLTYGKQKQRSRLDVRNSRTSNIDVQQHRHSAVKRDEPLKTNNGINRDRLRHHSVFQTDHSQKRKLQRAGRPSSVKEMLDSFKSKRKNETRSLNYGTHYLPLRTSSSKQSNGISGLDHNYGADKSSFRNSPGVPYSPRSPVNYRASTFSSAPPLELKYNESPSFVPRDGERNSLNGCITGIQQTSTQAEFVIPKMSVPKSSTAASHPPGNITTSEQKYNEQYAENFHPEIPIGSSINNIQENDSYVFNSLDTSAMKQTDHRYAPSTQYDVENRITIDRQIPVFYSTNNTPNYPQQNMSVAQQLRVRKQNEMIKKSQEALGKPERHFTRQVSVSTSPHVVWNTQESPIMTGAPPYNQAILKTPTYIPQSSHADYGPSYSSKTGPQVQQLTSHEKPDTVIESSSISLGLSGETDEPLFGPSNLSYLYKGHTPGRPTKNRPTSNKAKLIKSDSPQTSHPYVSTSLPMKYPKTPSLQKLPLAPPPPVLAATQPRMIQQPPSAPPRPSLTTPHPPPPPPVLATTRPRMIPKPPPAPPLPSPTTPNPTPPPPVLAATQPRMIPQPPPAPPLPSPTTPNPPPRPPVLAATQPRMIPLPPPAPPLPSPTTPNAPPPPPPVLAATRPGTIPKPPPAPPLPSPTTPNPPPPPLVLAATQPRMIPQPPPAPPLPSPTTPNPPPPPPVLAATQPRMIPQSPPAPPLPSPTTPNPPPPPPVLAATQPRMIPPAPPLPSLKPQPSPPPFPSFATPPPPPPPASLPTPWSPPQPPSPPPSHPQRPLMTATPVYSPQPFRTGGSIRRHVRSPGGNSVSNRKSEDASVETLTLSEFKPKETSTPQQSTTAIETMHVRNEDTPHSNRSFVHAHLQKRRKQIMDSTLDASQLFQDDSNSCLEESLPIRKSISEDKTDRQHLTESNTSIKSQSSVFLSEYEKVIRGDLAKKITESKNIRQDPDLSALLADIRKRRQSYSTVS